MDFLGAPAIGQMIQSHFHHFNAGAVNPRDASGIAVDVGNGFSCQHGRKVEGWAVRVKARFGQKEGSVLNLAGSPDVSATNLLLQSFYDLLRLVPSYQVKHRRHYFWIIAV